MAIKRSPEESPKSPEESRATPAACTSPATGEMPADLESRLRVAVESSERLTELGLYPAALDECYVAIGLLPTYIPAHTRIGEIQAARGQIEEAIEKYGVIANLCRIRGDPDRATEMYRRIVELSPGYLGGRADLVGVLREMGRESVCWTAVDRLMGESFQRKDWTDAISLLESMRRAGMGDDVLYIKLAEAHFRQGDRAGAARAFETLGQVYAARGEQGRALAAFRVAKELAPGQPGPAD